MAFEIVLYTNLIFHNSIQPGLHIIHKRNIFNLNGANEWTQFLSIFFTSIPQLELIDFMLRWISFLRV